MCKITISPGPANNPRGTLAELDPADLVGSFTRALSQTPTANEAWWSVSTFLNNHRSKPNWLSAIGVGADVDFHDGQGKHAPTPPSELASLQTVASTLPA